MIPDYLELENFMCYRGEARRLSFDGLHVACLSGENGAGKSALLDAITWAVWGSARTSDDELIAQGATEMRVEFGFRLNDQQYRVARRRERGRTTRSGKTGAGRSSVDFQLWRDGHWKAIGEDTIGETNRAIIRTLGMGYDTFINTSFLMQGRADEFTRKTPGERKAVLGEMLELAIYDDLAKAARDNARELDSTVLVLTNLISERQHDADKLPEYVQAATAAATHLHELEAALLTSEAALRDLEGQYHTLHQIQQQQRDLLTEIAAQERTQQEYQHKVAELEQRIAADETILAQEPTIRAGLAELAAARATLAHLDTLQPQYDALREVRRELQDQLKDALRQLKSQYEQEQHPLAGLYAQRAELPILAQQIAQREAQLATLADLTTARAACRAERNTIAEQLHRARPLLRQYDQHRTELARAQRELEQQQATAQRDLHRLGQELATYAQLEQELQHAQAQHQRSTELAPHLADLRQRETHLSRTLAEQHAQLKQYDMLTKQHQQRQRSLHAAETTTCPLCQSELGAAGMHNIQQHYATELARLAAEQAAAQTQITQLDQELAALRAELSDTERTLDHARQAAARLPTLHDRQTRHAQAQSEHAALQTTLAQLAAELADMTFAPETRTALARLGAELNTLLGALLDPHPAIEQIEQRQHALDQQLTDFEAQLADQSRLQAEQHTAHQRTQQIHAALAALPALEAQRDALQARIDTGDFAHDVRQQGRAVEAQLEALGYSPDQHTAARTAVQRLVQWEQRETELRLATQRLSSTREALATQHELIARIAAQINEQRTRSSEYAARLHALPTLAQQVQAATAALSQQRTARDAATTALIELRGLRERAEQAAREVQQRTTERDAKAHRQSLFEELGKAFGKQGVQALLIETAIPEIEREANRLLGRMTGNQMHISFEMQRTTKQGNVSETLDIKIADALGTRSYDAFSGGEAMRINFAIRVALSRMLAGRAGSRLELLIIDEGFGALDTEGRERFIEAISSVQDDFKRILVITHIDDLKDRFPARIEITRTPLGSVWAVV
ncbi:MAG: SMC family ATPase [Chloroflexaceae bacterium]|nr:SMC family ATPase [Chloroflexaceae bacterium]